MTSELIPMAGEGQKEQGEGARDSVYDVSQDRQRKTTREEAERRWERGHGGQMKTWEMLFPYCSQPFRGSEAQPAPTGLQLTCLTSFLQPFPLIPVLVT